ncbi:hypothetical protein EGH73_01945 [Epilithonimonas hominis]|uniref:Uncharacterized protein n=2 Tax=Epilithonimonas hominis TaxID=420404 RepID=A0A3N0XBP1_9FLAO|nr:hypothetical protein EGH73_01945 [Epilithonimonas hominis]
MKASVNKLMLFLYFNNTFFVLRDVSLLQRLEVTFFKGENFRKCKMLVIDFSIYKEKKTENLKYQIFR